MDCCSLKPFPKAYLLKSLLNSASSPWIKSDGGASAITSGVRGRTRDWIIIVSFDPSIYPKCRLRPMINLATMIFQNNFRLKRLLHARSFLCRVADPSNPGGSLGASVSLWFDLRALVSLWFDLRVFVALWCVLCAFATLWLALRVFVSPW